MDKLIELAYKDRLMRSGMNGLNNMSSWTNRFSKNGSKLDTWKRTSFIKHPEDVLKEVYAKLCIIPYAK